MNADIKSRSTLKAELPPVEPGTESRAKAWGLTTLLLIFAAVNLADKAVLGIIAQPLAKEIGLTATEIGLAGSLFFLTYTVGALFSGALQRWAGLRWSLVILAILWSASMLPILTLATFGVLVGGRMVLGLAEGPASPLTHTALYSWHAPEKRGFPSALVSAASSVAKIAIVPALALIGVTFGWRATLVTLAAASIVWAVIWVFTWEQGPYSKATKQKMTAEEATAARQGTVPLVRILTTRTFVSGVFLVMSVFALITVVLTWLPSYFEVGLGFSRLEAGSMFAIPSIFSLVFMLSSSYIGDRLIAKGATSRRVRIVTPAVGVILAGVLLFALPYISAPMAAVMVVSIGYAFSVSVMPLYNAVLSEIAPAKQISTTLGVFIALMGFGGLIAPYVTGIIVDAAATPAAGYAAAFQLFGVIAGVCAVAVLIFANPARDKAIIQGILDEKAKAELAG